MKKMLRRYGPFMILFSISLVIHLLLPLNWADDAVFLLKSSDKTLLQFLANSARPFTDSLTYLFARNHWLWRILNPIILTTLAFVLSRLIPSAVRFQRQKEIILCCTVFYPAMVLVDAGFIATTVNYLWPVTFGLLCLIPLQRALEEKKLHWYEGLLLLPLLLYATNMQQMCVCLVVILFAGNIYLIFQKKWKPYLLFQFFIAVSGIISTLLLNLTGDNSRMEREIGRYFPAFAELNLIEKAELGLSSTFYCMTMECNLATIGFLAFSLFLMIAVFRKKKQFIPRCLSAFPFLFTIFFSVISLTPLSASSFFQFFTGGMQHYRVSQAVYQFRIAPDFLFVVISLCILYCLFILLEQTRERYTTILLLLLGFGTRLMMGFSPTVWASGYRTFCILFLTFIITVMIIIDQNPSLFLPDKKRKTT